MASENDACVTREELIRGNLEAYLPYIAETIKPSDLLRLPCFSKDFVRRCLNFLIREIDDPNRFSSFYDLMSGEDGYPKIAILLESETAMRDERYRKLLTLLDEGLYQKVDPTTVLPHLLSKGTITYECLQEVCIQAEKKGALMAWWKLVMHLPSRKNDWFNDLMVSLIESGNHNIAATLEPDLFASITPSEEMESRIPVDNLNENIPNEDEERCQEKQMDAQDLDSTSVSDPSDMMDTEINEPEPEEVILYGRNIPDDVKEDEDTLVKTTTGDDDDTDANIETDRDAVNNGKEDKAIYLRDYQTELAKEGCEGQNVVIMAPTNSGKTYVATRIIQVHLQKRKTQNQLARVVFLVENEALAFQQGKVFAEQLPGYRTKVFTGSVQRDKGQFIWDYLSRRDILVVTAQLLVNALISKQIASLKEFSLIVFDECHHSNNEHMFNVILRNYIDMKIQDGFDNADLPQIVGLTASLGVGGSTDYQTGFKHMKTILANMDARFLCTVRTPENQEALRNQLNCPTEELVSVKPREQDRFREAVMDAVSKIDKYIEKSLNKDATLSKDQMQKCRIPMNIFGTEQYCNWSSDFNKYIAEIPNDILCRKLNPCQAHLEVYNNALLIHKDARITDALRIVDNFVSNFNKTPRLDETDATLVNIYEEIFVEKRISYKFEDQPENPKLVRMGEILKQYLVADENARAIVFVKTRELATALKDWINESEHLNVLNASIFVGQSEGSLKGGMTKCKQKDALEYFKGGRHRVIIATSVAEEGLDIQKCNLVIRYEHVTNEIVRLQSRGRARADNSRYFIISEVGSWILDKEEKNRRCEELMNQIVRDLQEYIFDKREEWEKEIREIQRQMKEDRDRKREQRKQSISDEVKFQCLNCSAVICKSDGIKRIKRTQYIIVDPEADSRVEYKRGPTTYTELEGMQYGGMVKCANITCQRGLGQVCTYKNVKFPLIKIKAFKLVFPNKDVKTFKKWKDVNCEIAEFTVEDLNRVVEERVTNLPTTYLQ